MKRFLKKHYGNIIFALVIGLLLIPQTRLPILVIVQRLLAGAPREISPEKRDAVSSYQWPLLDLNGQPVNFSAAAGNVTILNYWATWCPPCLAEMPSLQKLFNKYGQMVQFYCVSNETGVKLRRFMERQSYSLPVYIETAPPHALLQSSSLPTTFVISKTGKIAMRTTGAANWNSGKVHRLLDTLLAE